MYNTQHVGNKIAEARKRINISQSQLAERLFISPQAVGKWERGESMPDIITFNRLAEILGVDLNYFSENFPSTAVESAPLTALESPSAEPAIGAPKKKLPWDMSRGNWVDADFSGLKDLREKFSSSNMQRCKFIGSDLSGLVLANNNVDRCDFSSSIIRNSQIRHSNLGRNSFKNCSLQETEFSGSNISGCDFSEADLTGAVLRRCNFEKNILVDAVWNRTSFIEMSLSMIVFEGTLEDCNFEGCSFSNVTFQNATLVNTFFKNRNLKWIKFINCQADRMTYEFLKNGKADLSGVALMTVELGR